MLCPNCEQKRDPSDESQFKRLDVSQRYKHELNVVYVCARHSGGCGHVFSPGNPEIIAAYLAGKLVPADSLSGGKNGKK